MTARHNPGRAGPVDPQQVIVMCTGKHAHKNAAAARSQLQHIQKNLGSRRPSMTLTIYLCPFCQDWHVGSRR